MGSAEAHRDYGLHRRRGLRHRPEAARLSARCATGEPPASADPRPRARPTGGRDRFWRGLEELAEHGGVPPRRSSASSRRWRRARDWATARRSEALGASLALAGLTGCDGASPTTLVPYVEAPEFVIPGKPQMLRHRGALRRLRPAGARQDAVGPPDEARRQSRTIRRAAALPTPSPRPRCSGSTIPTARSAPRYSGGRRTWARSTRRMAAQARPPRRDRGRGLPRF